MEKYFILNNKIINTFLNNVNKFKKNKIIILKKNLNLKEINNFILNKIFFPNFYLKENKYRYYPYGKIISPIIGYIINNTKKIKINKLLITKNINNIGISGIETYYNNIINGKYGFKKIFIDNKLKIINIKKIKKSIPGSNINLTIDIKLQEFIFKLIEKISSTIIISNIDNGEILSLVSTPSFNNNNFIKGLSFNYLNNISNYNIFFNKIIQGIYPPASTIKPYIAISALQEKIIKKQFTIYDKGWWIIPNTKKKFYDWKKQGHGFLNIIKSIEESSDIYYYIISYKEGINNIIKWMKKFGYGLNTGIDLPKENQGLLPTKKWKINKFKNPWYIGDTISIGIGQGYWAITPIQMNKSFITFIKNGISNNPQILKKIKKENFIFIKNKNISLKNIKKKYLNIIKFGMYGVAFKKNGTAYKNFKNLNYKIAVKSGTAQLFSLQNKNKENINLQKNLTDHTLMNAFLPYEKPKIAITIILEHGGGNIKIGDIMRKITDFIILKKIF